MYRTIMFSRAFLFVVGAVYVINQVFAQEFYVAEVMLEANVTLDSQSILTIFDDATFDVTAGGGDPFAVTITDSELIAVCLIIGSDVSCNCSAGYTWSNEVCYANPECCRDVTCAHNVSFVAPLCVSKVDIFINGTAESASSWETADTDMLDQEFGRLNGLRSFTTITTSGNNATFEVKVYAPISVEILEGILSNLSSQLTDIKVDLTGMVSISAPEEPVCYKSKPLLQCSFELASDSSQWMLSKPNEYLELNDGTVVQLEPDSDCSTAQYPSCSTIRLNQVTGIWIGDYECGFTQGSIKYKSRTPLNITLLPDYIDMTPSSIATDCTAGGVVSVAVTVTVPPSPDPYEVWWSYNGNKQNNINPTSGPDPLVYTIPVSVSCEKRDEQYVEIFFKNLKDQVMSERLDITVLYDGDPFCEEETVDGDVWPNTPYLATVVTKRCPAGRSGFKAHTCNGPVWQEVFNYCVDDRFHDLLTAAENFRKGQGATMEGALTIIQALRNTSTFSSDVSTNTADVNMSIAVLTQLSKVSDKLILQEEVLPSLIDVGSDLLNTAWTGVNDTVLAEMAADYLEAMETLLERTRVNSTTNILEILKDNLHYKLCFGSGCQVTVFDVHVVLNKTVGISKVMAINNLMHKLNNNFLKTNYTNLLVSATVDRYHGGDNSAADIWLDFPIPDPSKPHCVFWNISTREWSDFGCALVTRDDNRTECECNHLTSFSVLMSKGDVSTKELDVLTHVGLAVSLCSLILLLLIEFLVWAAVVRSNLSHFRHTAIVNISTFRLLADICFLASIFPKSLSEGWCLTLTLGKHLFYLAMFCWMMCLSIMLVHQLIFVFSPLRKRVFMFLSSIVGYMFPIVIVGSSYVYCKYTDKPYYTKDTCWLVFKRILEGSLHAFLIPVTVVILTNVFSLVVVVVTLVKTSVPDPSKAAENETAKGIIKVIVLLAPLFGVTWIIGFFLLILDHHNPVYPVANYTFTILNSFQGLFILIGGCIADQKVREELIKRITGKSSSSDSSKNLTSTTQTN